MLVPLLRFADMTSARPLPWWTARLRRLPPRHKGGEEEEGWRCWRAAATSGDGKDVGRTHTHTQAHKTSGSFAVQPWKNGDRLAGGSDPFERFPSGANASACLCLCVFKRSRYLTKHPYLDIWRIVYPQLVPCISESNNRRNLALSSQNLSSWSAQRNIFKTMPLKWRWQVRQPRQLGFQRANAQPDASLKQMPALVWREEKKNLEFSRRPGASDATRRLIGIKCGEKAALPPAPCSPIALFFWGGRLRRSRNQPWEMCAISADKYQWLAPGFRLLLTGSHCLSGFTQMETILSQHSHKNQSGVSVFFPSSFSSSASPPLSSLLPSAGFLFIVGRQWWAFSLFYWCGDNTFICLQDPFFLLRRLLRATAAAAAADFTFHNTL